MNFENNVQMSFCDSELFNCNNWAIQVTATRELSLSEAEADYRYHMNDKSMGNNQLYKEKLHNKSCSTSSVLLGAHEKNQFLKEIGQVREEIVRFRTEMNGLARQIDGMEIDLNHSKNRVQEVEEGLTETQEVNVNLQVLLEKAVHKQKETDVYATRAMRHIHTNLATVVYETGQLKGRLTSIAKYQKQHQGSATSVAERMREYTHMLEQAQGTIKSLKRPPSPLSPEEDVVKSLNISKIPQKQEAEHNSVSKKTELYGYRIIKRTATVPSVSITHTTSNITLNSKKPLWLPPKGLRILLSDYRDF